MPKYFDNKLDIRRLTGITQLDAAMMLGISREAVANYESGNRPQLPGSASLFHALLITEMNKATEPSFTDAAALTDASRQKLRKELEGIVQENRFQAEKLKREIEQNSLKQSQQQQRLRLLSCVEKVQAQLLEQSNGSAWQPVNQRQQKWLELAKGFSEFTRPDDKLKIELSLLQLRHKMLLQEADEAERMLAELS